jgi:hypothetical protein
VAGLQVIRDMPFFKGPWFLLDLFLFLVIKYVVLLYSTLLPCCAVFPKAIGPNDHGLKPLNCKSKQALFLCKLIISGIIATVIVT